MSLTELAISGPLLVAAALAWAAGVLSFASPCALPLVPGYVAYLAGLVGAAESGPGVLGPGAPSPGATTTRTAGRWRVTGAAMLFVAGFTVVFVGGVTLALGVADWLIGNELLLQRLGGVVTIAMGLVFLGFIPALQRDLRIHNTRILRRPARTSAGLAAAPVLGAVYGLGWTPCLGPTLTGVIALATGTQVGPATLRGLVLVLAYCAGLGVPFVLIALGTRWAVRTTGWMRRHLRTLQVTGGVLLLVLGGLLVTGAWGAFVAWMRGPVGGYTLLL